MTTYENMEIYLLLVLLKVAVGDFGRRPHIIASAVFLYFFMSAFEATFELNKLDLDKRTCKFYVKMNNQKTSCDKRVARDCVKTCL